MRRFCTSRSFLLATLPAIVLLARDATGRCDEANKSALPTWTKSIYPRTDAEFTVARFSPDGNILALGTGGLLKPGTVKLLDPKTMQELPAKIDKHLMSINTLSFSPDGRQLAFGSGTFTKKGGAYKVVALGYVWDLRTGRQAAELQGEEGEFFSSCFSPDGTLLATGDSEGRVVLWDLATAKSKLSIKPHAAAATAVVFSADGKQIISGGKDGKIVVSNATSGAKVATLEGHVGGVRSLILLKGGNTLLSVGTDGQARLWNLASHKETRSFPVAATSQDVAMGKDGRFQVVQQAVIRDASLSADEKWLAVGLFRNIKIFEFATGKEAAELIGHTGQLNTACFSPSGNWLASGDNFDARLWSAPPSSEGVRVYDNGLPVYYLALSADGSRFATPGRDSTFKIWDSASGKVLREVQAQDERGFAGLYSLALSPDGKLLATGGYQKNDFQETHQVKIWDSAGAELLHTLSGHEQPIRQLAFSPDGKWLASGDDSGSIRLWNAASGEWQRTLSGLANWPNGLVFSPDGKRLLATAAVRKNDEFVGSDYAVWNVEDGQLVSSEQKRDKRLLLASGFSSKTGAAIFMAGAAPPDATRELLSIDPQTKKVADTWPLPNDTRFVVVSNDEKKLAAVRDNDFCLIDLAVGENGSHPSKVMQGHSSTIDAALFTADGRYLFTAGGADNTVRRWDVEESVK